MSDSVRQSDSPTVRQLSDSVRQSDSKSDSSDSSDSQGSGEGAYMGEWVATGDSPRMHLALGIQS